MEAAITSSAPESQVGMGWVVWLTSGRRNKEELNLSAKRKVRNWLHRSFNSADIRMSSGRYRCLPTWGYLVQSEIPPRRGSLGGAHRSTQRFPAPDRAPGCSWHPQHTRREMFLFSLIVSISSSRKRKVPDLPSLELQTDKKPHSK